MKRERLDMALADKCRSIEEFREALKKAVEENDEKK